MESSWLLLMFENLSWCSFYFCSSNSKATLYITSCLCGSPQKRPFAENGPWVNVAALCSLYVAHYSFLYLGGRNTAQYYFRIAEKSSLSSRYLYLAQKGSKMSKLAIILRFWARKRYLNDWGDFLAILKEYYAVLRPPRYTKE